MNQHTKPIDSLNEIPANLSDEEHIRFLEESGVSEKFLEETEEVPQDERPRPRDRTRPINVRFDEFTLGRLKDLADRRNVGYQTLLKTFVSERLYQEELREGVLPADQAERILESPETVDKRGTKRHRDWLNDVHEHIKENEGLLEDPDLDSITNSRLASNSTAILLELSGEIKQASAKKGLPANRLRRMMKAFDKLKAFCEKVLKLHEERFGTEEPEEGQPEGSQGAAYDVIREAERLLHGA